MCVAVAVLGVVVSVLSVAVVVGVVGADVDVLGIAAAGVVASAVYKFCCCLPF